MQCLQNQHRKNDKQQKQQNQCMNKKTSLYYKLKELVQNDKRKQEKEKQNVLKKLPQSFWNFMKQKQINIEQVLVQIPRYIRLKNSQLKFYQQNTCDNSSIKPQQNEFIELKSCKQGLKQTKITQIKSQNTHKQNQKQSFLSSKIMYKNSEITIQMLKQDLGINDQNIVKISNGCFALSPSCKINHSKFYEEGRLYGMDISSMYAVQCLDIQSNNKILQLCSAPGNKSMYACDLQPSIAVTGIQINPSRANIMKNLINKYGLSEQIQVIVQDATKFQPKQLFDRVLVDAECTHQGSVKHLKKFTKSINQQENGNKKQKKQNKNLTKQQQKQFQFNHNPYASIYDKKNQWSAQDFQKRFLDPVKLSNLYELQFNLIKNGFKCLKPDGIMVYSTCSIDRRQNQEIVLRLLEQYKQQAVLMDAGLSLKDCQLNYRRGTLKQTIYFTPNLSMCGGMFISKITKKLNKQQ